MSATKVGFGIVALDNTAVLRVGFKVSDHWYVSGNPCGSVPLPFRWTVVRWATVWFGPALAVGASGGLVVVWTVAGALSTFPSLTINCATYVPGRSAVNMGLTVLAALKTALLPLGTPIRLHR